MSTFDRIESDRALITGDVYNHLRKINRFNLPEGFLYLDGLRGHVFITRPDLNLFDAKNNLLPQLQNVGAFTEMTDKEASLIDKEIALMLQHNTGHPSPFIPVLTNYVKGYAPEDQTMETIEMGETLHGIRIKYGKHFTPSRSSGTITLTFEDSKYLPVYKLISLWTEYIELIYYGDIAPKEEYLKKAILDYAVALYYIVTKSDGSEIVYWEKLIGVFPRSRPDSAFATTKDQFTFPEYSIQFDYSMKSKSSILDPYVLAEFNKVSGYTHKISDDIYSTYNHTLKTHGEPYVNAPRVERGKDSHDRGKLFLRWV